MRGSFGGRQVAQCRLPQPGRAFREDVGKRTWTDNPPHVKCLIFLCGGMAERLKALVLKTSRVQKALVGSNPTPSAFSMRSAEYKN